MKIEDNKINTKIEEIAEALEQTFGVDTFKDSGRGSLIKEEQPIKSLRYSIVLADSIGSAKIWETSDRVIQFLHNNFPGTRAMREGARGFVKFADIINITVVDPIPEVK